jgi:hypothetical protein
MFSPNDMALEAVQARREQNFWYYGELLKDMESAGLSSSEIRQLLDAAEARLPHPESDRALRVLRSAAKAARRGQSDRVTALRALACALVGDDEVLALTEEHRLSFCVQRPVEVERRVRAGFAV